MKLRVPIRMIKTRRMRLLGHVARMARTGTHIGYWWQSQKEINYCVDQEVVGWIMLKWILERWDEVVWTGLSWLRIGTSQWWALMKPIMKLRVQ
jgi:hypothetical protein